MRQEPFPAYHVFDLEHWARKEHYFYYTENLPVSYSVTVPVDVKILKAWCRREKRRFYPMVIYCMSRTVNELEFLRMFRDHAGRLCVWESVNPCYTVFHEDDHTFSDMWSYYDPDPDKGYRIIAEDMEKYGNIHSVKARGGQPANFFCVSVEPWFRFTGYAAHASGQAAKFFPVITCGKYEPAYEITKDGSVKEKLQMPVSVTVSHAVADGYHTGLFFKTLQQEMNRFGQMD